jgi:Ca2+-binding RTX toxin-like protein
MVTFNFSFQPGVSLQQMIGFEIAGRVWSQYLTDNVTVNVHVGMSNSLASNVLGGSLPGFKTGQPYSSLSGLMANDATSADDRVAFPTYANPTLFGEFNRYDAAGNAIGAVKFQNGSTISLTRANAKALKTAVSTTSGNLDGYIVLNDKVKKSTGQPIAWNYNYTSTAVPTDTIDFLSTAMHEVGHVLGFASSVDRPWEVSPIASDATAFTNSVQKRLNEVTMLDTFRTTQVNNYPVTNLSVGGSRYLSLDFANSATAVGYFATGKNTQLGGNGFQASHWRGDSFSSGLMNAALGTGGQRAQFSLTDLRAFDAIGWDLSSTGVNTVINWSTLQSQAKQALASRLGQPATWLDLNVSSATSQLDVDRLSEVNSMLSTSSDIYEGRGNGSGGSWQELFNMLDEQGLLETLSKDTMRSQATRRNDMIVGSTEGDELVGLRGNDQLIGFAGDDQLRGNKGNDLLMGNIGRDILIGGEGDDTLIGGKGRDRLMGGNGKDIFVVQDKPGIDQVMDFTQDQDKLMLTHNLKFDQLNITQQGQDTLISSKNATLMLLHSVNSSLITVADMT